MRYFLAAAIVLIISGCTSSAVKDFSELETSADETAAKLRSDRGYVDNLDRKNHGDNGYYYILKNDGDLTYHPEKGLIGSDFSRYGFVKKVIRDKNGCIRVSIGNIKRIIIFREIGSGETLCYASSDYELTGSDKCELYINEETK